MEEIVIELMCLCEIFLLHFVPYLAVFAICAFKHQFSENRERKGSREKAKGYLLFLGNRSWFTTMLCVSIPYDVSSCISRSVS